MRFRVVRKSSKNINTIQRKAYGGNEHIMISGTYPSLIIDIIDEVKEGGNRWSPNKTVSLSHYSAYRLVTYGERLLEKMKEIQELYVYENGKLIIDRDLAWSIRVPISVDYGKTILLLPVVVRDENEGKSYEGISFVINEISSYALLTYDEFAYMLYFIKHLNFDTLAMQLINLSVLVQMGKNINRGEFIQELPSVNNVQMVERPEERDYVRSNNINEEPKIPEI